MAPKFRTLRVIVSATGEVATMRVLFTSQPESGHWHPLVPLARAAEEAGHEVAFAMTPSGCVSLATAGFHCFPIGTDESDEEIAARRARMAGLSPEQSAMLFWSQIFPEDRAGRMLSDLIDLVHAWRPDVIVREFLEFSGCAAAEVVGIPHAAVQVAAWRPRFHPLLVRPLAHLRQSVGLAPDPDLRMPYRFLFFATSPPSFYESSAPLPATAHPLRPIVFDLSGNERLPEWFDRLPDQPTVYATMGTVVNTMPGILEAIVSGLQDEPLNLILSTGRNRDPADFGPQPPHMHIERYIPQSLLFPHCDLVVAHGGTGTVMAALSHGLPMVILPVRADQPDNARRCAELGVARVIALESRTPDAIREAVQEVLANPSYREYAIRLKDEMQTMPGPDHAVLLLDQLVSRQLPLVAAPKR
jgi:UDP:flavonoid glycosyltransferase YjiC (YdhE family)